MSQNWRRSEMEKLLCTPQLVSFDGGAEMVVEGAYDDEECKTLLKTEYFLKVARGNKLPVGNMMKFNSRLQCWEVVRLGVRLPCWLDHECRSLRTKQNDSVMDMGGSLKSKSDLSSAKRMPSQSTQKKKLSCSSPSRNAQQFPNKRPKNWSYIHLTHMNVTFFCDFNSNDEARETIATLKEAIKKYEEFFKKANLAILRSGRTNIPNAANAFLVNLKKKL
ncbi:hypothetical protein CAEBREN_00891 [Caenorhabditis brenneri]|uniref:Uncharacterized protein n=1 Tax=Caenorhabditis brenneri TaxID=135651 RepID=G0NQS4_CAEBE|nr:hypothetical protein CAEBREN_00891 [Caenorhabditis brenneri]